MLLHPINIVCIASSSDSEDELRLLTSRRCSIIHQCISATRAVARGAVIISVDFDVGNIDEVDGLIMTSLCIPFENLDFQLRFWIRWPLSNPPTELSRFSNFGLIVLLMDRAHS